MIVYLARDIPAFVMYCVYGSSRSSLLIDYNIVIEYSLSLSLMGKTFINVTIYSIQIVKGGLPPSPVYIMPYKGIAQLVHK